MLNNLVFGGINSSKYQQVSKHFSMGHVIFHKHKHLIIHTLAIIEQQISIRHYSE